MRRDDHNAAVAHVECFMKAVGAGETLPDRRRATDVVNQLWRAANLSVVLHWSALECHALAAERSTVGRGFGRDKVNVLEVDGCLS